MDTLSIRLWLENIDESCHRHLDELQSTLAKNQPRKRKLHQQPSPPISVDPRIGNMPSTPSPPKKRKIGDSINSRRSSDPQVTPKQSGSAMNSRLSVTSSTSLPPSENGRVRPRSPSPRKVFMNLRLEESGIEFQQLDNESPPAAAADLVQQLCEIDLGMGILPREMEDGIRCTLRVHEQNERLWRQAFDNQDPDEFPGHIPSWQEVTKIRDKAMCCFNEGHEEASWNTEVHHRLLEAVFRGPAAEPGRPFDFMTCTTARPYKNFIPRSSTSKMIDFCLYESSNSDERACRELASETITVSINHTDYAPLQLRPIILSIETKRPGKDLDIAQLQIGVWQSAQWTFLRHCVKARIGSNTNDAITMDKLTDEALAELGFIPGVIVQGHRWLFVFSTREANTYVDDTQDYRMYRTVLWTEQSFGSTQSHLKIYQIIAGLRRLTRWARDTYMPWHRRHVLAVPIRE